MIKRWSPLLFALVAAGAASATPAAEQRPFLHSLPNIFPDIDPPGTVFVLCAAMQDLVRLAKLRWRIELDYREMKDALGLDHFEGRSFRGWHHHVTLVSLAHGFLTLQRLDPKADAPA